MYSTRLADWTRLAVGRGWRGAAVVFFIYRTHSRFASVRPIITFLFSIQLLLLSVRSSFNHISIQIFVRRGRSAFNHFSIQPFPRRGRSSFNHISIQPFLRRGRSAFNPISVQSSFKAFFHSFLLTLSSSTWSFRYFTSLSDCKVIEGYGRMDAKRE